MATSTTTIRTTTTMSGVCVAESDRLYSFRSLYDAYASCRRRKRNTINALRFESFLLDNLVSLGETLADGTYKPARSVCFVAKQPKHREIFAADFRDRVVHHLLVPQIEKIFEPKFIHDSYACRKDKGTHAAVARLQSFMNRITKGGRIAARFMQLDIRSFFMSIDREILLRILAKNIRKASYNKIPLNPPLQKGEHACHPTLEKGGKGGFSDALLWLTETIVRQDCTKNFTYKGDPRLLKGIPPHKSLFHIPACKGLPIGNLTSQFFGNVYLNELDQFVKHEMKVRYYLRYVDDFILLDPSRERLLEMKEKIGEFLEERLALSLKAEFMLKRVSEGANFLGYIVRPDYVLVRNRVVGNLGARLRQFRGEMVQHKVIGTRDLPKNYETALCHSRENGNPEKTELDSVLRIAGMTDLFVGCSETTTERFTIVHLRKDSVHAMRQTLASYLGHFKHANAFKLTRGLFEKYEYLKDIFALNDKGRLIPVYEPPFEPANLRGQYKWVTKQYAGCCIFLQVGKFCEFYDEQAERFGRFFGLKTQTGTRMNGLYCGFPLRYLKDFKEKTLHAGIAYVVVGERGYYPSGLKKRVVTEIFRYDRRAL
jgi:hypothetical protein